VVGRADGESRWSVNTLLGEYCSTLDTGKFDEWVDLFTGGGQLELGPASYVGSERLHRFATKAPRGVHISGVPVISIASEGIVSTSSWIFVGRGASAPVVGYYHDTIVWAAGRHRFSVRRIEVQE
jgi:hypothetical protein